MNAEGKEPSRRWKKTPAEVVSQIEHMWMYYREKHNPDPAEVVEDIFTDILDSMTGFCYPDASWTEPDEPEASEPSSGRE